MAFDIRSVARASGTLRILVPTLLLLAASACSAQPASAPDATPRDTGDPFLQLTSGIPTCPPPPRPQVTDAERRAQAHDRVERGNSCYLAGRCRLPNSYLYDSEIIPRVKKAVAVDGRFDHGTSVWAEGQRRWVWLKGCVATRAQADQLVNLVRDLDDVEQVVDELKVWPPPP